MALDFGLATISYLADSYVWDLPAILALQDTTAGAEHVCKALSRWVTEYGIARNFGKVEEEFRYQHLSAALKSWPLSPTEDRALTTVIGFVNHLKPIYSKELLSASTKLLWLRFQSPIVIYDGAAWQWLHDNEGLKAWDYRSYLDAWRCAYRKHRGDVRSACETLADSGIHQLTAPELGAQAFQELCQSDLFQERVFDHAMLIDQA